MAHFSRNRILGNGIEFPNEWWIRSRLPKIHAHFPSSTVWYSLAETPMMEDIICTLKIPLARPVVAHRSSSQSLKIPFVYPERLSPGDGSRSFRRLPPGVKTCSGEFRTPLGIVKEGVNFMRSQASAAVGVSEQRLRCWVRFTV